MIGKDALYIISVAAKLVDMHPSTLRKYERVGFLEPSRVGGKLRLYSTRDISRLRQIKYLVEERGVNLAGVDLALDLTDRLRLLRETLIQSATGDQEVSRHVQPLVEEMLESLGAIQERAGTRKDE